MKKYDSYKDSGVEWIGKVPENWGISKVKFLFDTQKGKTPKNLLDKIEENSLVYLAMDYLRGEPKQVFFVSNKENVVITNENETLLLWDGSNAGEFLKSKKGVLSSTMALIKSKIIDNQFQWYSFKSFESILKDSCNGMGIPHVDGKFFRGSAFLVPPIEEQQAIVNYLDQKTTQIEHLISKKEQFIQLLEEERVAVINQAVTKGLDPTVPMKESGIEWLGEIPEHWEVKKLRFIGNCQNGISAGAEYFGTGYPFVSYGDVYKNEILPISVNGLAQSNEKEQLHYSIDEGDVFFTRTSETIEEIGISSICFQKIHNAVFAGFLIRFRPNEGTLNMNFSKYFFRSKIPRTFFVKEMNLVTRASLSQELLKRLPILLPSIDEQKNIGEFLNKKTNEIDDIVGKTRNEIELLKEYKTALISEVVTGKVDVREEKIN
jgi:type I restriction enzyme S subunit